jgi:hypothetical protein
MPTQYTAIPQDESVEIELSTIGANAEERQILSAEEEEEKDRSRKEDCTCLFLSWVFFMMSIYSILVVPNCNSVIPFAICFILGVLTCWCEHYFLGPRHFRQSVICMVLWCVLWMMYLSLLTYYTSSECRKADVILLSFCFILIRLIVLLSYPEPRIDSLP